MINSAFKKVEIISKNRIHESDTGSVFVQIALLTSEINHLSSHMEKYRNDNSARYSLLKKIHKRARLIKYLRKKHGDSKNSFLIGLGLRIKKSN